MVCKIHQNCHTSWYQSCAVFSRNINFLYDGNSTITQKNNFVKIFYTFTTVFSLNVFIITIGISVVLKPYTLRQINTVVVTAKVSYFLRLIVSQCNINIKTLRVIKYKKVFYCNFILYCILLIKPQTLQQSLYLYFLNLVCSQK